MIQAMIAFFARAAIASVITGTIEALVSLFRKPVEQRLGEAEAKVAQQAAVLTQVEKANEIRDDVRTLNDADVHERLYSKWRRG